MNEFGHTYIASSDGKDFYSLVDEAGVTISWAVESGGDSRALIDGSIRNEGIHAEPVENPEGISPGLPPNPPDDVPAPPPVVFVPPPETNPPIVSVFPIPLPPDEPQPQPSTDMANQFGHTYEGSANGFDSYSLVDDAGTRLTWRVNANDDSRAIVAGSLVNQGQAVNPPGVAVIAPPPSTSTPTPSAPGHRFVGRDSAGNDVYQLTDAAGVVVQWSVVHNGDSRAPIAGSIRNLDQATPPPPPNNTPNPARGDPTHRYQGRNSAGNDVYQLTDNAGNIVRWQVAHGGNSAAVIDGTIQSFTGSPTPFAPWVASSSSTPPPGTNNPPPSNPPPGGRVPNSTHVLAGYDRNGNDVYQLIDDAATLVEWAVVHGADSRAIIAGTLRNLANGVLTQVVSQTRPNIPGGPGPGTTGPGGGGVIDSIASQVSIPQLITAGLLAIITR